MGSLYKRKHKNDRGAIVESPILWLNYYQNGRPVRESSGTTKETVARRMLRDREGDVEKGVPINPKVGRVTFEEASTDFLTNYFINGRKTYKNAQHRIEVHLAPHFRGKRLISITSSDISAFVAARMVDSIIIRKGRVKTRRDGTTSETPELRKPVSAGEINRELATLKRMFTLAKKAGKLHHVPHIERLREDNVRRGFFEREQFESVRAHLPEALQPVVTFAYLTGWRLKSEVLPIEWRQIDWEGRTVKLDPGTTKNGEGRTFPFTGGARATPRRATRRARTTEESRPEETGPRRATCVSSRRGTDPNLPPGLAHGVPRRRRAGSHPARLQTHRSPEPERIGVPRSAAMAMVGHKTESIYRRYAIVDAGVLRDAAAKIDRAASTLQDVLGTLSGTPEADAPRTGVA